MKRNEGFPWAGGHADFSADESISEDSEPHACNGGRCPGTLYARLQVEDETIVHRLRSAAGEIGDAGLCRRKIFIEQGTIDAAAPPAESQIVVVDLNQREGALASQALAAIGAAPICIAVGDTPELAASALSMGALDCLDRAAPLARYVRALQRAADLSCAHLIATGACPKLGIQRVQTHEPKQWVRALRSGALVTIHLDDALYFQAERKLTRVVFPAGDAYLHMGINTVAEHLDPMCYWRVHRSTIINARHIEALCRDDIGRAHITLKNRRERLPVSKPYEKALFKEGLF